MALAWALLVAGVTLAVAPARRRPGTSRRPPPRTPVTVAFLGLVALHEITFRLLGAPARAHYQRAVSTSVHNLVHRPLVVLPLSAFVSDDTMVTTVLILAGLAGLWRVERRVGSRRVLLVAVLAHVAITYLTEGAIAVRVALGALPPDALRLVDVGPSYVVVPLLAAAALLPPPRAAAGSAVVLLVLAPQLLSGLPAGDVAAVGHLLGMALGVLIGVGWRAWPPHHRPR